MGFKVMAEQSPGPQARWSILGALGGAALALSLGACQLVPAAPVATASEPQPVEAAQAQPEPVRARPMPVIQTPLVPQGAPHRIAVLVPTSGDNAGVGQSIANAANLALTDANGSDRVRITVYDTARGAAGAAAQALADGNRLFLGPLLAEDVKAVAPVARRGGVPVVAFSNDTNVKASGVYLMGFTPGQSIARVVDYARGEGAVRFAALVPEGIYGGRASEAMIQSVRQVGGSLIGNAPIGRGSVGLKGSATRLASFGAADAVLIADSGRVAAQIAPLLGGARSAETRILGTELWAAEDGLGETPALRGAWFAAPSDQMFNQLRTRYRDRFGANPYRLASLGYDAVLMTLRIARGWRSDTPFPEGELRNFQGFPGLDGAFRFGSDGVAERALEVREVTATGTTVVSPAPRGFN
ncbi:MAG TPA: penicillin-binding protein activator [Allosphingosinicella sp.]|jgi:outer membrane PBP1 activator LpoA protein